MFFSSARIESGSNRNESIEHGTSARVETIRCASYRDEILSKYESLKIPFDVRSIIYRKVFNYSLNFNLVYSCYDLDN